MNGNGLQNFKVERILSNNTNRKTVCLLGHFDEKTENALVVLEKKAFSDQDFDDSRYFVDVTRLEELFVNDIYGNYELLPNQDLNSKEYLITTRCKLNFPSIAIAEVKTTIISPCTEDHIRKYSQQQVHLIQETPELYKSITLRNLEKRQFSLEVSKSYCPSIKFLLQPFLPFQWVYNILEHKKEVDRIVFEDPDDDLGFVLLPDLKWDGKTLETLYCLAITRQRNIKSLRDLNESHLPLLRNIRDKGIAALREKYGVKDTQLRIYFHYQPTFYHLHIHFTYLKHEAPGIFCEKSHLLETVIDNIALLPDYYQKAILPFVIRESDPMFDEFSAVESNGQGKRFKAGDDGD